MRSSEAAAVSDEVFAHALRTGDQAAFTALVERYRHQLQVHCYRLLGSFDDAEDLVQETLLRAWRGRASFEGRSRVQTWLYRIATNACLSALERAPRRVIPQDVVEPVSATTDASQARESPHVALEIPWIQPYPDLLLDMVAPPESGPELMVVARESIELVFITALQHLPPRQRAIFILRDVLDWSAKESAALLEMSVASVNSAHQRARATMRLRLPSYPAEPVRAGTLSADERSALQTFMDAWERADPAALMSLVRDDARWAMPPAPLWFEGRAAIVRLLDLFPMDLHGRSFRMLPVAANRQPATAAYMRSSGESTFQFVGIHVLRIEAGGIADITTFGPELCRGFALPPSLSK